MRSPVPFLVAGTLLAPLLAARPLAAQCPDGTPPPCGQRMAAAPVRAEAPGPEVRGRSFLVLPFRNVTRSEEHAWLVEGSPVLLSDALGHWEEVSVVPPERLYPALRRAGLEPGEVMEEERVRRVAEETRGWTAVTGDVLAMGPRIRVSARAYDVVDGELVVEATEEVTGDEDIRVAFDRLAGRLLTTAGIDEGGIPNLASVTTESLEAYKSYLAGMRHLHRGEDEQAAAAFLQAVEQDSTFAHAYAKLAMATLRSVEALIDPGSDGYRYAEKAAALAPRLPPRDRTLIEGYSAFFRADFPAARERFHRLLDEDPNDVEALEALSGVEQADAVFRPDGSGGLVRRGSMNESARFAKRVLALDPTRHQEYASLSLLYGMTAGLAVGGHAAVVREEPSSLPDFLMKQATSQEWMVLLLTDSVELVPRDTFIEMDRSYVEAARRRGAAAARGWVDRWLAAAPDASQPHQMAVWLDELEGEYEEALRHLAIADSIGVETSLDPVRGRRAVLLMKAGRRADAAELFDSLRAGDYFTGQRIAVNRFVGGQAAYALQLYLGQGRFRAADEIVDRYRGVLLAQVPDTALAGPVALCLLMCRGDEGTHSGLFTIADSLRLDVWTRALAHLGSPEADSSRVVASLFEGLDWTVEPEHSPLALLARGVRAPAEQREVLVGLALSAGENWSEKGETAAAARLAAWVVHADSTDAERLERAWAVLERVAAAEPDNAFALYQMGKLGAVGGLHVEEAIAAMERAIELGGEDDPSGVSVTAGWARMGRLQERAGRPARALAAWREVLARDSGNAEAKAAVERLGGGGSVQPGQGPPPSPGASSSGTTQRKPVAEKSDRSRAVGGR